MLCIRVCRQTMPPENALCLDVCCLGVCCLGAGRPPPLFTADTRTGMHSVLSRSAWRGYKRRALPFSDKTGQSPDSAPEKHLRGRMGLSPSLPACGSPCRSRSASGPQGIPDVASCRRLFARDRHWTGGMIRVGPVEFDYFSVIRPSAGISRRASGARDLPSPCLVCGQ